MKPDPDYSRAEGEDTMPSPCFRTCQPVLAHKGSWEAQVAWQVDRARRSANLRRRGKQTQGRGILEGQGGTK